MIIQANPGFWVKTTKGAYPVIAWLINAWDDGHVSPPIPITPSGYWPEGTQYKLECPTQPITKFDPVK